jgi:hypothetical protein
MSIRWHCEIISIVYVYTQSCVFLQQSVNLYVYVTSPLTGRCSRYYRSTWVKVLPQLSLAGTVGVTIAAAQNR